MKSLAYYLTRRLGFFIYVAAITFLSFWNVFSRYPSPFFSSSYIYDPMTASHINTSLSAGWVCQAFILHDTSSGVVHRGTLNSRGQLKLKKGFNKFNTDDDCEDFEGISTTSRRSKRSNNKQSHRRDKSIQSRREFIAWNSILAGIASGSIFDGTNAEEIANTIITPPPTA